MRHEIIIENIILDYYFYYLVLPVWYCMEGVHKRIGLYKVLTHSQGNLEAKEEPRTTNMGQIMYRKNLFQGRTAITGHLETSQVPHLVVKPGEAI